MLFLSYCLPDLQSSFSLTAGYMLYWFIIAAEIVANYTPSGTSNILVGEYDAASHASTVFREKVSVTLLYNMDIQKL